MEKCFSWFNIQKLWHGYSAMDSTKEYVSTVHVTYITYLLLIVTINNNDNKQLCVVP